MNKIIVAVDGSEHSMRAVAKAKEIGKALDSTIILVNVVEFMHHLTENVMVDETAIKEEQKERDGMKKRHEALLVKTKSALEELGDKVQTELLEGNPAHELIKYIESSDADLVILGSHGVKGLGRFMLGSVVSKVIHHVDKSVLIVR